MSIDEARWLSGMLTEDEIAEAIGFYPPANHNAIRKLYREDQEVREMLGERLLAMRTGKLSARLKQIQEIAATFKADPQGMLETAQTLDAQRRGEAGPKSN